MIQWVNIFYKGVHTQLY